jgi:hypothetical protein
VGLWIVSALRLEAERIGDAKRLSSSTGWRFVVGRFRGFGVARKGYKPIYGGWGLKK